MTSTDATVEGRLERDARAAHRRFYEALEMRCKRFQPDHFGPACVATMRYFHEQKRWVFAPEFQVGMMIEANCAYTRTSNHDTLTRDRYAKIKNLFRDHDDPALAYLIKRDFGSFFLVMHRQQIELQKSVAKPDASRYFRLFLAGSPLPRLTKELESRDGITPEGWLKSCLAMYAASINNPYGWINLNQRDVQLDLNIDHLRIFATLCSRTPDVIGERFCRLREQTPAWFHTCIRSNFVERPLIDFGGGKYLAPFPSILFHHGSSGLYRRLVDLPSFSQEFGSVIQDFVEHRARNCPGIRTLARDKELERESSDRSCDLVIEFDDYLLLVEAKTAEFSRDIISPGTIPHDNSTRKIRTAIEQVERTGADIRSGRFSNLGISRDKPIWSVITTFGDVPFVNADWYRSRYLTLQRSQSTSLAAHPVVLPIRYFELLVTLLRCLNRDFPNIHNEWKRQGYTRTGDWDGYLEALGKDVGKSDLLEGVQEDFEAFFGLLIGDRRWKLE